MKQTWNNQDEEKLKVTMKDWPQKKAPKSLHHRILLLMQAPKFRIWHLAVGIVFMMVLPPIFAKLASIYAPTIQKTWMITVYVLAGFFALVLMGMIVVHFLYELESGQRNLPKGAENHFKKKQ